MREAGRGPKRFYQEVGTEAEGRGFRLALDGRAARTPGRNPLVLETRPLADAVAAEWRAQAATIDPATMPLTRLVNTAIDGVAPSADAVRQEIARFAGSDLVVYRAGEPEALIAEQAVAWDPVLDWARAELGARFMLSQGVTFVEQPASSLARVRERLVEERSPLRLAALHVLTTLSGSVLLALMHEADAIAVEHAWAAAHVDELFQEARWGRDAEAAARRALRSAEFHAASRALALTAVSPAEAT